MATTKKRGGSMPAASHAGAPAVDGGAASSRRTELTAAERAEHLARRKELYEGLHPETKHGVAGAIGKHRKSTDAESASVGFVTDTAKKTGIAARTVAVDVQIGAHLAPDVMQAVKASPLAVSLKPMFEKQAKERQAHGQTAPGKTLKADLPEVSKGQARDQAAAAVGVSGRLVGYAEKVKREAPAGKSNRQPCRFDADGFSRRRRTPPRRHETPGRAPQSPARWGSSRPPPSAAPSGR